MLESYNILRLYSLFEILKYRASKLELNLTVTNPVLDMLVIFAEKVLLSKLLSNFVSPIHRKLKFIEYRLLF